VGVTSLGGKAGGPLTTFDAEGEDILLSPPPALNKSISSSSSSSWSSSHGGPVSAPKRDIAANYYIDCPKSGDDGSRWERRDDPKADLASLFTSYFHHLWILVVIHNCCYVYILW
jgi:hypothetical protein